MNDTHDTHDTPGAFKYATHDVTTESGENKLCCLCLHSIDIGDLLLVRCSRIDTEVDYNSFCYFYINRMKEPNHYEKSH